MAPTRPEPRNPRPRPASTRPEGKARKTRPCDLQEGESARVLRGRRTRGSGSGNDKGDAHNWFARDECKTTGKGSLRVEMEWLCKISREARDTGLLPMFTMGFDGMPSGFSADWFAVPAETFDAMCGVLEAVRAGDLLEAERCLRMLRRR